MFVTKVNMDNNAKANFTIFNTFQFFTILVHPSIKIKTFTILTMSLCPTKE